MAERGVNGLAVLGALGEGHKLSESERAQAVKAFKEALQEGLGLVVGVRGAATDLAIGMALQAKDLRRCRPRAPRALGDRNLSWAFASAKVG